MKTLCSILVAALYMAEILLGFPSEKTGAKPKTETITLSFLGDCTIGDDDKFTKNSFDIKYKEVKNPAYFFEKVQSIIGKDDYTYANLECALTKETKKAEKTWRYRGYPEYVDILVKGSVEGVNLANNHTFDYFQKGFDDTVKTLNNAKIDYSYQEHYFIKEIKGARIAFLGYTGFSKDTKLMKKQIEDIKKNKLADFIVANIHWGNNYDKVPIKTQRVLGKALVDLGADLVVGHHAHILQGKEVYKGKTIMYSIGNFCYGGSISVKARDTIIYQCVLTFDKDKKQIIKVEEKLIPAFTSGTTDKNNYQPVLAEGKDKERILKDFAELSAQIK